ncbi:MAG: SRPBCC family protein [Candidatus Aquicultorales bacterium]
MPTTTIEETIHINARPQIVWLVFSEIEKWPLWNPISVHVSPDGEFWRPGGRLSLTVATDGKPRQLPLTVVETKAGKRVRWRGKGRGVTGELELTLEPVEGRTRVVAKETLRGWLLPLVRLVVPLEDMEELLRVWLDALRRESERRARELREVI